MYVKQNDTMFGVGEINGEPIMAFEGDFDYPTNVKLKSLKLPTYKNNMNDKELYLYKDKLCTRNELIIQYLKEYYSIKD